MVAKFDDGTMAEVRRLAGERGSEWDIGTLYAWRSGTADLEQRAEIERALVFQGAGR